MATTIICPHCNKEVEVTKALQKHIEEEVSRNLTKNYEEKLKTVQKEAGEKASRKVKQELELSIRNAEEEAKEERERGRKLGEQTLELTKQLRALRKESEDQAIEMEKRLFEEEDKIRQETKKKSEEEHRLKDLEKEKVITDLKKSLEEAQRKASLGSQQLQGEILELDIESILKEQFPQDAIEPVAKGTTGADIKQVVKSPRGLSCGVILWELKRTKSWSDSWLSKLKDDLRSEKANVPIIISQALPKEITNGMGVKDGVWIVNYELILPLAILVRKNILDVAYQKAVSMYKGDKAEMLHEYITGHEFRQQVEALVEVYQDMNIQIQKERVSFEKSWKVREMQVRKLVLSTANIYGSMQGVVGSSMPQVKGLDLFELESGE